MVALPYINSKDVKAALEDLNRAPNEQSFAGLQRLLLVDLRMSQPGLPKSDRLRDFAMREVLVDLMTAGYRDQRAVFNLPPPNLHATIDRAVADLAADSRIDAPDLLAWSVLYYRYVRADLNLAVEMVAERLGLSTRSITRSTDNGVELLTNRLIQAEEHARVDQLRRSLYAALPVSADVTLLGRDGWLNQALERLPTLAPCHFLVTGAAGIGKTMVVQKLMQQLIDDQRLEHLIWIDHPRSVRSVRQQLVEALLREDGAISLRDYCLRFKVAVVLDGIEAAATDRSAFDGLLRDLGAALVGLINRTPVQLATVAAHLPVAELTQADAYALVRQNLPYDEADQWVEIAPYLYEQVGGSPMALKLGVGMLDHLDGLSAAVIGEWFGRLFNDFSAAEQRVWCALALFPQAAPLSDLHRLWEVTPELAHVLIRHHLAESAGTQSCILLEPARDYLRQRYDLADDVRSLFDGLVASLQPSTAPFDLLEYMLACGLPSLDPVIRENWIKALWPEGIKRGHWARWREILEDHGGQRGLVDVSLRIAYGICLRRLGDWPGAQQVFTSVVKDTGAVGDFPGQARALIEWAILAQYQGDYQQAGMMLGQVRRYAERASDGELLDSLHLQEARLAIQAQRGVEAADLLDKLPETPSVLALRSEAQLVLKHYPACRSLAERVLALITDDLVTAASLNTIIGRSYEAQRDFDRARVYFTEAVTLFQRANDGFGLARAQTNLAAALIHLGREGGWLQQASDLLAQAEQAQRQLGDKVGLSATRHNQSILVGDFPR